MRQSLFTGAFKMACATLGVLTGLSAAALAASPDAHTLNWPVGERRTYRADSGELANAQRGFAVVYQTAVHVENAAWLRLFFEKAEVPDGGELRITSALDGEVQELKAAELVMWDNSTAYLNGDTVTLELIAAPGTSTNRVVLSAVTTQIVAADGPCASDNCGICGSDDRVLSAEMWAGRLMPVGCTASVYNTTSCVVSAGHCAQSGLIIQFNVPLSSGNCATHNPPVNDQFPITNFQYTNGGIGNDWSVMTTGTNGIGQHPFDRYGEYRPVSPTLAAPGNTGNVWGYGVDNGVPAHSQVQQFSTGTITSRTSTYYTYRIDITYGNSGSSLLVNDQIVGIVTHCSVGCPDWATRIDLPTFVSARHALCPDTFAPTPDPMTFDAFGPVSTSAIAMTATMATDPSLPISYDFTFVGGGSGGASSGWVASTIYENDGLTANTPYTYMVRARDAASPPNMTGYSDPQTASTFIETPTGVTFGTVGADTIELLASGTLTNLTAGSSGLYFDSTTPDGNGGIDTWIQTTSTQATGLSPDTLYTFQVKARNQDAAETAYSASSSQATLAAVPSAPTLSNATQNSMQLDVNANGNPSGTDFAVQCTATSPLDASWDGQYVSASGQPSATAVWQTDAQWDVLTVTQLQPDTTYTFAVKGRNQENVETAFGPGASLATQSGARTPGDLNCDGVVNFDDINPFVLALADPAAYSAQFPNCNILNGDCNSDGLVDFDDINAFVALLGGG